MSNITETDFQNRREYSRLEAHIPMEIRIVPPEERMDIQSGAERNIPLLLNVPKAVEDPLLSEWLKFINAKMDAILRLLDVQNRDIPNMPPKTVNIGGGGLSFISPERFFLGDTLEVKMLLPSATPQFLFLYCEVVQSEERCDGYFTALRFIFMEDTIRDKIIRFVFEKERAILREKRRE